MSTAGRAKVIIILVFLIGFSLGSYTLWTVASDIPVNPKHRIRCLVPNKLQRSYNDWSTAILRVGTLALPGFIITILTTTTVVILMRASRKRREHMEGQTSLSSGHPVLNKTISNLRVSTSAERQLSVTLVTICVAFVVLRMPYTVCYYLSETLQMKRGGNKSLQIAKNVTDVIATSNYVVNLMIYCFCGSYFRQQVLIVYSCRQRRWGTPFGSGRGRGAVGMGSMLKDGSVYNSKSRSSTTTNASIV